MSTPFSTSIMESSRVHFPPASPSDDGSRPTTIEPQLTSRNQMESQRAALDQYDRESARRRAIIDSEYRRFFNSRRGTGRQFHDDQATATQNYSPAGLRPRGSLGARLRQRVNAGYTTPNSGPVRFGPASFGRDLPEPTLPRIGSPDIALAEISGEAEVNRQRKRRKRDDEFASARSDKFHYTWGGYAQPGPLKMEIHDCDGGLHPEQSPTIHSYKQQNVLVNDKSVYCTEMHRCNLILKHVDDACFTLTKIVIKAPGKGFTAPIQEGLIFVGSDVNQLTMRTSRYRLSSPSRPEPDSDDEWESPSSDTSETRPVSRRRDSTVRAVPPPISDATPRIFTRPAQVFSSVEYLFAASLENMGDSWLHDHRMGHPSPTASPQRAEPSTTPPAEDQGFNVTAHCNDPSDDEEEESSPQTLQDRYQRELMSGFPSNEEALRQHVTNARRDHLSLGSQFGRSRGKRRESPSRIEILMNENLTPKERKDTLDYELKPHAKFFIEQDKSVVSLSFEPAIAGRYILFKLFGPSESRNIDIQSISVYGFAGPRVFPAMDFL